MHICLGLIGFLFILPLDINAQLSTQLKPDKLEFLEGAAVRSYLEYNSIGDLILRNQNTMTFIAFAMRDYKER